MLVERKACCHLVNAWVNLAHTQPENLQKVQKMRFWKNAPGVNWVNKYKAS